MDCEISLILSISQGTLRTHMHTGMFCDITVDIQDPMNDPVSLLYLVCYHFEARFHMFGRQI